MIQSSEQLQTQICNRFPDTIIKDLETGHKQYRFKGEANKDVAFILNFRFDSFIRYSTEYELFECQLIDTKLIRGTKPRDVDNVVLKSGLYYRPKIDSTQNNPLKWLERKVDDGQFKKVEQIEFEAGISSDVLFPSLVKTIGKVFKPN